MVTTIKSYLCGSVPVQKGLPKLLNIQEERSQGGTVMGRRVEARQFYFGGCRIGLYVARVSALCTKREFPASEELLEDLIYGYPLRYYGSQAMSPGENGS